MLDRKLELLVWKHGKKIGTYYYHGFVNHHHTPESILNYWNSVMDKPYTKYSKCGKNGVYAKIDKMIARASCEEALNSKWNYVRKAKMWFVDQENNI